MMEGSGADSYGATGGAPQQSENSKLMATAVAGAAMEAAKTEAAKIKNMVLNMRDGPVSIKILSYIAGILLVVTGFFSFFGSFFTLHPVDAVVHLYMFAFGWAILLLEARSSILPKKIVYNIHKYCAFTTVVWGRGAFFIFVGTLALAQWVFISIIVGLYLVIIGAGMIYWGQEAYKNLDALHGEMKNPEVVEGMFRKFDHNQDGVLDVTELGNLLESLGAMLRPTEVEAACIIMDTDNDGKISLAEFQGWWANSPSPEVV
ncbi:unnamed protein product [Ectocarpus sp. 6 AP-2014]